MRLGKSDDASIKVQTFNLESASSLSAQVRNRSMTLVGAFMASTFRRGNMRSGRSKVFPEEITWPNLRTMGQTSWEKTQDLGKETEKHLWDLSILIHKQPVAKWAKLKIGATFAKKPKLGFRSKWATKLTGQKMEVSLVALLFGFPITVFKHQLLGRFKKVENFLLRKKSWNFQMCIWNRKDRNILLMICNCGGFWRIRAWHEAATKIFVWTFWRTKLVQLPSRSYILKEPTSGHPKNKISQIYNNVQEHNRTKLKQKKPFRFCSCREFPSG